MNDNKQDGARVFRTVDKTKKDFWLEQREIVATNLAFAEMEKEFLLSYPETEVIGNEKLGEFAGSKGMKEITAGEALKKNETAIDKAQRTLVGLEKLLKTIKED